MEENNIIQILEKIGTIKKEWSEYYNGYYIDAIIKGQRIEIISDTIIRKTSTLACTWTKDEFKNLLDFCNKIQEKEKVYICINTYNYEEYEILETFEWGEHEPLKSFSFSSRLFLTEKEIENLKED